MTRPGMTKWLKPYSPWNIYDMDLFDLLHKLLDKRECMPGVDVGPRSRWTSGMWGSHDYIIRMRHYEGLKLNIPKPNDN